jgi:hypothetical protein
MIDSEELLVALCGRRKVAAFKEVKLTSMRLARVVKQVIAEDLDGSLPPTGKQFLTTSRGTWRLAARANSDNTTEESVHRRLGVRLVQVFGELTDYRRSKGWITVEDLYGIHSVRFDAAAMLRRVATRLQSE